MNHQDELPLAKVSEIDEAKRQWLQGMRHPVEYGNRTRTG